MGGVLSLEFLGDQSPLSNERASFTVFLPLQMNGSASQWNGCRKTHPSRSANQKGERGEGVMKWTRMLGGDLPAFLRVLRPRLPRLRIWRMRLKAACEEHLQVTRMEGTFWILFGMVALVTGALIPEPEVKIEVLHKPFICKRKTKFGDLMLVHYDGYLEKDGSLFHSTHKHNNGQPTWFTLGIKEVIQGWDKGLKQMCIGEKRKLTIPSSLAYGKEGKGKIPPESTLIFHIDLLEIRNGPRSHESFQEMDLNDDWKLSKEEVKMYLKTEFEKHGAPVNASHHDNLVKDIFHKEDEDNDGFISAREFVYKHDEL